MPTEIELLKAETDELLDALMDECQKLRVLLRAARPLAEPESPDGLQWMLDVRAALTTRAAPTKRKRK